MDERVRSSDDVVKASAIVVRGGSYPCRIVLRKLPGKFVTHLETLTTDLPREGSSCAFVHAGFQHGHYFDFLTPQTAGLTLPTEEEARRKALSDFDERSSKL